MLLLAIILAFGSFLSMIRAASSREPRWAYGAAILIVCADCAYVADVYQRIGTRAFQDPAVLFYTVLIVALAAGAVYVARIDSHFKRRN